MFTSLSTNIGFNSLGSERGWRNMWKRTRGYFKVGNSKVIKIMIKVIVSSITWIYGWPFLNHWKHFRFVCVCVVLCFSEININGFSWSIWFGQSHIHKTTFIYIWNCISALPAIGLETNCITKSTLNTSERLDKTKWILQLYLAGL